MLVVIVVVEVEAIGSLGASAAMREGLLVMMRMMMMVIVHTLLLQYTVRVELVEAAESSLVVSDEFALRRH